MTVFTVFLVK